MYSFNESPSSDKPTHSDTICAMAMSKIADLLIKPMTAKPDKDGFIKTKPLTPQQDSMLAIIGMTFMIMAEKATVLEKMEQGFQGSFTNENDFNRN